MIIQIFPKQKSTTNWYMVLSFHGSIFLWKSNAKEGAVATLITWTLSNAIAARLVGKYSEKLHNTFHSLIKYLTCWPLSSSHNIELLAIRRNFLVMLLKFNRFNFKVPNADFILFFVKKCKIGWKTMYILLGCGFYLKKVVWTLKDNIYGIDYDIELHE